MRLRNDEALIHPLVSASGWAARRILKLFVVPTEYPSAPQRSYCESFVALELRGRARNREGFFIEVDRASRVRMFRLEGSHELQHATRVHRQTQVTQRARFKASDVREDVMFRKDRWQRVGQPRKGYRD